MAKKRRKKAKLTAPTRPRLRAEAVRADTEIHDLRMQLGLKQAEAAACLGINLRTMALYEAGKLEPKAGYLRLLRAMIRHEIHPTELDRVD